MGGQGSPFPLSLVSISSLYLYLLMIELTQVTKQYGLLPVLRGVNLQVAQGEFVTLIGPNGAGKSTLLRIVATLLQPNGGEVQVGGWPLPSHAERVRRHLGLVSHQPLLYGDLTAEENLLLFARLYALPHPEQTAVQALKLVGLARRAQDPVRTFSRGMWQRLSIARATLHNPDVLLLDEPYTGLDHAGSALLDGLLQEQHALGRTILMITHDLIHGLDVCDRMAILHRGRIVHECASAAVSPADLLTLYRQHTESV